MDSSLSPSNLYKLEINFVDGGYRSLVQINYWTHDVRSLKIQQKIGFTLPENFNQASLYLDVERKDFTMYVRQTQRVGKMDKQKLSQISIFLPFKKISNFMLTTFISEETINAPQWSEKNIISHKCFGGYEYGKIKLNYVFFDKSDKQNKRKMSVFNHKTNQTKC